MQKEHFWFEFGINSIFIHCRFSFSFHFFSCCAMAHSSDRKILEQCIVVIFLRVLKCHWLQSNCCKNLQTVHRCNWLVEMEGAIEMNKKLLLKKKSRLMGTQNTLFAHWAVLLNFKYLLSIILYEWKNSVENVLNVEMASRLRVGNFGISIYDSCVLNTLSSIIEIKRQSYLWKNSQNKCGCHAMFDLLIIKQGRRVLCLHYVKCKINCRHKSFSKINESLEHFIYFMATKWQWQRWLAVAINVIVFTMIHNVWLEKKNKSLEKRRNFLKIINFFFIVDTMINVHLNHSRFRKKKIIKI